MQTNDIPETTDSWSWGKIIKYVLLPKPKGSPRAGKKEIFARIGVFVLIAIFVLPRFFGGNSLPSCDSADTVGLLKQIYNESEFSKDASFVSIKNMSEQGFNKESEIRACTSYLVTSKGPLNLQYSVKWQDKKAGTFLVEINSAE